MKKACKTRWLSFDNSVKSAYQNFRAVLQTLRVLKLNDDATADGLLTRMKGYKFVGALAILNHVLSILASLSRAFQKGNINFGSVQLALSYAFDNLQDLLPTDDNDLFSSVVTNGLKADIAEGGRLEALELQPSDFEWKQMKNLLTNYISALTANLKSRFSSSLPILECFTIFDLLNLPDRGSPEFKTYGSTSLKKLANHFVQSDTEEDKQMKEEKMTAEWGHLKYQLLKWKDEVSESIKTPNQKQTMVSITPLEWSLQKLVSTPYMGGNVQRTLSHC